MKTGYGVALIQMPLEEGLTRSEVTDLFDMLSGVTAIPVEFQGENAVAAGFINLTDAELLDHEYSQESELGKYIRGILDDVDKEVPDGGYVFNCNGNEISIYMSYGE